MSFVSVVLIGTLHRIPNFIFNCVLPFLSKRSIFSLSLSGQTGLWTAHEETGVLQVQGYGCVVVQKTAPLPRRKHKINTLSGGGVTTDSWFYSMWPPYRLSALQTRWNMFNAKAETICLSLWKELLHKRYFNAYLDPISGWLSFRSVILKVWSTTSYGSATPDQGIPKIYFCLPVINQKENIRVLYWILLTLYKICLYGIIA
jgi:hypothetical protein